MARNGDIEKMSYAELVKMEAEIGRLKTAKQNEERTTIRDRLAADAKKAGFDINELFGRARKGKGSVAAKYRDPDNPSNTWTGRGRMPRWLAAATKGGKKKRDDFLIK